MEFVLVLPAVGLALALVLVAGGVGMEMVQAQHVAREAARAAAVAGDAVAADAARTLAGDRVVRVRLDPPGSRRAPGDVVAAEVDLTSAVLARLGFRFELSARAAMRSEAP